MDNYNGGLIQLNAMHPDDMNRFKPAIFSRVLQLGQDHDFFYRPDILPVAQPTVAKQIVNIIIISLLLLFGLIFWRYSRLGWVPSLGSAAAGIFTSCASNPTAQPTVSKH